jgi:hypothetical protein
VKLPQSFKKKMKKKYFSQASKDGLMQNIRRQMLIYSEIDMVVKKWKDGQLFLEH